MERSWGHFGPSWGDLGTMLGSFWSHNDDNNYDDNDDNNDDKNDDNDDHTGDNHDDNDASCSAKVTT